MKTIALIVRREDTSRADFREHYESIHAPLAKPILRGLDQYVRHHIREEIVGKPDFDVVTSFRWRDREQFRKLTARLGSEEGAVIARDEQTFMNKPANCFFAAEEDILCAGSEVTSPSQIVILLKRQLAADRVTFSKRLESTDLPELIAATGSLRSCMANSGIRMNGYEPIFDSMIRLSLEEDSGEREALQSWAARFPARGEQVIVIGVSEHQTPMSTT